MSLKYNESPSTPPPYSSPVDGVDIVLGGVLFVPSNDDVFDIVNV